MRLILALCLNFSFLTLAHAKSCDIESVVSGKIAGGTLSSFQIANQEGRFGLAHIVLMDEKALDQKLVPGTDVKVELGSDKTDRYGRRMGQVYLNGTWMQGKFLYEGSAVIGASKIEAGCFGKLRQAEKIAQNNRLGLWKARGFPLSTRNPSALLERKGEFVVAQGEIVSVGDRKTKLYLNFGGKWSQDFTAIANKKGKLKFDGNIALLKSAKGAGVILRGVVESSGGPMIRLLHESQFEMDQ